MLGLSDTTVGAIVSMALHAGVAAAFCGSLGMGEGAGVSAVMVSIDGVKVVEPLGQELQKEESQPAMPVMPKEARGALQSPKEQPHPLPRSHFPKRPQRPSQPLETGTSAPQPQESGGGGLLGPLYSQPVMLSMPKPLYPQRARERGVEGKVGVKVWVTSDGSVERAEVVKSSGAELLDRAAYESALGAEFKPALKAGVPTAAEKTIVVTFGLVE